MKVIVEAYEKALKFRNGRFVGVLEPGRHKVAWLWAKESVIKVDLRQRTVALTGQEMMTADKVTLRMTALATFRVTDPVAAVLTVDDYASRVYSDLQLALREHVAGLELEALLRQKAALGAHILEAVKLGAAGYGVEILSVGLRDLILPGEMKAIFNRVMEAQKEAEAALIRRREEVAATRSQANTAAMLERNPTLMRLKELETLEKISGQGASILVGPEWLGLIKKNGGA